MEVFFEIPVLFKLTGVFGLILVLIRCKQHLGTALLAGSLLLGIWCGMGLGAIARSMGSAMIQPNTILLNAIVVQILILSHSMERVGQMERLLTSFRGMIKNSKLNLVVFPALIGLLPMPGGAIFSAPMVDQLSKGHHLDGETKSMLNYWFRHVWEFAWPLYPGVLLASSMASVSVWAFISRAFPLTVISIGAGYLLLLRPLQMDDAAAKMIDDEPTQWAAFGQALIPIALVIVGAISGGTIVAGLQSRMALLAAIPTELPLVLSLSLSILYVWIVNRASGEVIRSVLWNKALVKMIYMVTAIYIFKELLVDSRAVVDVSAFLASQHIPLLLVVALLPWIVGMIAGIAVAFVGTTFPVLISLFQTM
ncbi:DUF401 family protein, partial [candidate division KSB3 bacterium]|nr:DUF401 family protein [candidate division KSB3 bacterium]MBD3327005.1 DUF401 family protein [candidate division KSB3 bacterium]